MARPREAMQQVVSEALQSSGLCDTFAARPPYQRKGRLTCIYGAKRPETWAAHMVSMRAGLRAGHGYMGMPWHPRGPRKQN